MVSLKTDFKRACCCMSLLAFLVLLLIAGIAIYAAGKLSYSNKHDPIVF